MAPSIDELPRDEAIPGSPSRAPRRRVAIGAAVAALYLAVVVFNLVTPTPQGPADQGDFARVIGSFSSGPKGLPFWPGADDPASHDRFVRHYHRFWRLDAGVPLWYAQGLVAARIVFWPGRLLRFTAPPGYFDLAFNTALVAAALAVLLAWTLASLSRGALVASLAACALVLADLRTSWFLNSFYQEALAYVALVALACALHRLFDRETPAALVATLLALLALAAAKFAFAPSALVVAIGVGAAYAIRRGARRAWIAVAIAAIAGGAATAAWVLSAAPDLQRRHVAYNFLFTGALHAIPEGERGDYLAGLLVRPDYLSEIGKTAYDADSRFAEPPLQASLGAGLHLRAIVELARWHPAALLRLLGDSLRTTGVYDIHRHAGYGLRSYGEPERAAPSLHVWSDLREAALPSTIVLPLALLLGIATCATATRRGEPLLLWYGAAALALVAGALVQVALAILGNGYLDLHKHLYLGGVLLDLGFVLAASGATVAIASRARSAAPETESPAT
jgi:hypothetical protein